MKNRLWFGFLIALICFCASFFYYFYDNAKRTAIADLNEKQMSYAREAKIGIEDFFKQWTNLLSTMGRLESVAHLNHTGRDYLTFTYESNKNDITAVTRVDEKGRIVFTTPFNPKIIGQDISGQKHIREVMTLHQPAVSDVFKSVQGFDMVALHVPIMRDGKYLGTIGVGINFQNIARRYLEGIKIGETGYAWMISRDGKELYCPVPGHMGHSVFENCKDYPDIIAMAKDMIQGKQGMAVYTFNQIRDRRVERVRKHAVYMPIPVGQTYWSLVVASSESEILASLVRFRNNLLLIIGLFLIGGAAFSFFGLRGWFIIREENSRKQAEAALQESEERFRMIFYTSPEAIVIVRLEDGLFVDINEGFTRLTGYSREDILGRISPETGIWFHPEARERLVQELRENGYYENMETDLRIKSGAVITALVSARLIFLGGVPHILSVTRDVSERKRAENALRESEAKLREIIEFLPDATLVIDSDGAVIAWNKAMEELTGIGKEAMLGKGNYEYAVPFYGERRSMLIDLVLEPQEDMEKTYRTIKRQGDLLIGEAHLTDLKGKSVYLLNTASPLYDTSGAMIGAIETIRDITGHRRMEQELASEHARLTAILDSIPVPAFMIDRNRIVTLWNRSNELITGKPKDEALGKPLDLSFLFKDKIPPILAEMVLDLTDEELIQTYGSGSLRKSDVFPGAFEVTGRIFPHGEERTISIQAARVYNPQGDIIGAVQTAQDITERIRSQKEQERLQSQLIQAQKMEAIGTLAGGIAHDFNNILTGIMGYTELYKDGVRDRPKVHHSMEQVLKAAKRAKDLVTQILTFSRKADRERMPVLLGPIVKEVVKFMRASLPATIEIRYKSEATFDIVMADPSQMHQVLMNLCTNAGHAMRDSGGVLAIELREVKMDAGYIAHHPALSIGRYLELSVRDTGHGIPPENMERIFEPYFTTKQKGEGTGLGLAVVHGIVKDHGGDIRVYSEPGQGTVFRIYLPLMESRAETEPEEEEIASPGRGETILFVDDERMVVELSTEVLETLGYRVIAETDPVRAVEVFRARHGDFDLVITDKTMPHMTGFEVAQAVREIRADIPVIFCSGIQERGDVERLASLNVSRLILKPISMNVLARTIREVLEKKTPERR